MTSAKYKQSFVTIAPLKDVVIFSLKIRLWSGRGKLAIDDLGIDQSLLPPEAVATLGSKRLIDREALKPLERVKRKFHRAVAARGVSFLTGHAHSHDAARGVASELKKLVKEGNQVKEEFLKTFYAKAKEWQDAHPNWAHIISAALPNKEYIAARISFDFQCAMADTPKDAELAEKLLTEANGLSGVLWAEVEDEAFEFVRKSLASDRNDATQRTLKPIVRMVEKLERLSFLDHRIHPLVDVLQTVLRTLPTKGKLESDQYLSLVRLGGILSSKAKMQEIGQAVYDGLEVDEAVTKYFGNVAQQRDVVGDLTGSALHSDSVADSDLLISSVAGKQDPSDLSDLLDAEPGQPQRGIVEPPPPVVKPTPTRFVLPF